MFKLGQKVVAKGILGTIQWIGGDGILTVMPETPGETGFHVSPENVRGATNSEMSR